MRWPIWSISPVSPFLSRMAGDEVELEDGEVGEVLFREQFAVQVGVDEAGGP